MHGARRSLDPMSAESVRATERIGFGCGPVHDEVLQVKREDFRRNSDVVPVSDPHIFSETQRVAQMQSVMQLSAQFPQIFDQRAVVSRMLKQLKVPNINELMPNTGKPAELNAADENSAMALGRSEAKSTGMP